ncbi:response regulator [Nibricoccus sp. IMCC34717]|uniref:response regulator n=1 Tax=Nibricoccus sp. IMCC34717 TaxID=3034021 RepID=UPI00384CF1C2
MQPTKVVLVDDHRILREGLRLALTVFEDLEVVGEACDEAGATEVVARTKPDVVVLDLRLGEQDGLHWAQRVLVENPKQKIVVLSAETHRDRVQEALRMGVSGFVVKSDEMDELVRAIRHAHQGHLYLCPDIMTEMMRAQSGQKSEPAGDLSERDREIVRLVALGLRNKEIAAELGLSAKSIETYRLRLMRRLDCESMADLIRWAIRKRIITP